jgi:prolyl 4-hydroxylase
MIKEELDSNKIFVLHDFLSAEECGALIRRSRYGLGTVGGVIAEGMRNNERVLIDDKSLATSLFDRAEPWLPKEVEGRRLVGFNERWRFYRYRPEQTFRPHRDGSYLLFQTYEQSEVTFMIYLKLDLLRMQNRPRTGIPICLSSR